MRHTGPSQLSRLDQSRDGLRQELSRNLWTLPPAAACVTLLGFLETSFRIYGSFNGCIGEKGACMSAFALSISASLLPCGFGLALGIGITWIHASLQAQLDRIELEIRCTIHQLFQQALHERSETKASA
jgi:biopolymer transport protein ExbB/TolQ